MPSPPPASRLGEIVGHLRRIAHLCVGVPAYETYRAHRLRAHPGEPVMSYADFHRDRVRARYARGAQRCC